MSAFERPYRPRKPTRKEEEADAEQRQYTRRRRVERAQQDHNQAASRDSGLVMSSLSGIGYRDYTLGSSRPFKTRNELDRVVYAERQLPSSSAPSSTFPSLQSTCISVAADNYGAPGVWSQLDRFAHLPHVPALLQAILDRAGGALLPFAIWAQFAAVFGDELPSRRRTYRGLCVADEAEIESLKLENEQSLHEWAQAAPRAREMLATPCFFLAVLDLANDVSFGDQDVSKLRKLAPLLAVLKLDYTRVTDDGLAWIARSAAGKDGAYQQLQVLSLKGLRKVSDEGVLRLGKLPLRMLDLRETICTKRVRTELTLASSSTSSFPPWTTARFRQELDRVGLELELFGGSFSLSRTLTYLHSLAHRLHSTSRTCTAPTKPVSIHLDAITRQLATSASSSTTPKSAEDLYHEQMALTTKAKNAAYNQAYGAVTSTMSISRQSLEESGMVETEKGAAYRYRNDAVAGGAYVGVGKTGGRSLFDVGQRKLDTARRPLSDTEEELELEEERRASEVEAARAYDAQPQGPLLFYRAPRPIVSEPQKRTIGGAAPSDLLLLRHLPYRSPFDTPLQQDEVTEPSTPSYPTRVDTAIVKRRKRTDDDEADDLLAHFGAIAAPSRPGAPPTRPPKPLRPANPFAAKRKATLPTSAPPPLLRRAELGGPTSSVPPAQQQPQARKLVLARPLPGLAKRR